MLGICQGMSSMHFFSPRTCSKAQVLAVISALSQPSRVARSLSNNIFGKPWFFSTQKLRILFDGFVLSERLCFIFLSFKKDIPTVQMLTFKKYLHAIRHPFDFMLSSYPPEVFSQFDPEKLPKSNRKGKRLPIIHF